MVFEKIGMVFQIIGFETNKQAAHKDKAYANKT